MCAIKMFAIPAVKRTSFLLMLDTKTYVLILHRGFG